MFSSNKQNWETPKWLFDLLNNEYCFDLDAAASDENAKVANYFTESDNALVQDWGEFKSIFCNPPYETKLQNAFVKKAYEEHKKNKNTIVLLLPARVETKRWHQYIFGKAKVHFLEGRLKFEYKGIPCQNSAPFPSAIVIYGGAK